MVRALAAGRWTVGMIGLGGMGSGIARRLLGAGHEVVGWNRSRERAEPLIREGMRWADSPRDVAAESAAVLTMLTDAAALTSIADDLISGLAPSSVWIEMSTIAPDESRALAARLSNKNAFLDAPVSGSLTTLAEGQLAMMVGGDRETFTRVEPLLLDIGPRVLYLGPQGSGTAMKLAINVSLVVQGMSFCESVAMAERAGIGRELAVQAFLNSVIASPMLGYRGPMVLEGRMPKVPFANAELQQKDQELGLRLGRELGTPLPFASLANTFLTACKAAGFGDQEWIAVYKVFQRLGGAT